MNIRRSLYIAAPAGDAVHAMAQSYAGVDGRRLVEAVTHHAFNGAYYYTRRTYRRFSDNGGKKWNISGPAVEVQPDQRSWEEVNLAAHHLDPATGVLVGIVNTWQIDRREAQFDSQTTTTSYRAWYELSSDGGSTWSPRRPVIQRGEGFDTKRWLPDVIFGRNGAYAVPTPPVRLDDGAFLVALAIHPLSDDGATCRTYWFDTAFLRGRVTADGRDVEWEQCPPLKVDRSTSSCGCCEADLVHIEGDTLFATMRCQGDGNGVFSSRQGAVSRDGGRSWSRPRILSYDDGKPVYVPAAFSAFLSSPLTGRIWWFANILDHPVPAQYPRCPLAMAELDPRRLCLIRDSLRIVQDLPPGAPACRSDRPTCDEECGRQYTNFGAYTDRNSGEMVLTVPEMPKTSWADFTSDCIEIRIRDD